MSFIGKLLPGNDGEYYLRPAEPELLSGRLLPGTEGLATFPEVRAVASNFNVNGTTIVVPVPTGTQDGDLMVMVYGADNRAQPAAPPGWQLVFYEQFGAPGGGTSYAPIFVRTANNEPANYTAQVSGSFLNWSATIISIKNADGLRQIVSNGSTFVGGLFTLPSIDVAQRSLLLTFVTNDHSARLSSTIRAPIFEVTQSVTGRTATLITAKRITATGIETGGQINLQGFGSVAVLHFEIRASASQNDGHLRSEINDLPASAAIFVADVSGVLAATETGDDTAAMSGTVSAGAITGTLTATETGSDTATMSGVVLVTGTIAATEAGADTAALTGVVTVTGTLSATEAGSDTAAMSGAAYVTGTLAATETGSDTAALSGAVTVTGTLDATETGADTAAMSGTVSAGADVTGTLAATETGSDTAAMSGVVLVTGTIAATESGSDTAAMTGVVTVTGTLAATETGSDTAAMTGAAYVTGTLAATETGSDTAALSGVVTVTGTLAAVETGADTAAMSGVVAGGVTGVLAATESGSDAAALTGAVLVTGTLSATETGADLAAMFGLVLGLGARQATQLRASEIPDEAARPAVGPGTDRPTAPVGQRNNTAGSARRAQWV